MEEAKFCDKCFAKYVGNICPNCKGKGPATTPKKVEGKGK